jgi:REP element-mobilizing transposase RayT
MPYDPERHRRRSIRVPGYDYATPGVYYVTINIQYHACVLGMVEDGVMVLSHVGQMVDSWWGNIVARFPCVQHDAYVVMPNHLHGLLRLGYETHEERDEDGVKMDSFGSVALDRVMRWFKSATTRDYQVGVDRYGWAPYPGRFWQRNYYEHIVRDDRDLDRIRAYIDGNPSRWTEDEAYREFCSGFG